MYFADPFWVNARNVDVIPPTMITEMRQRPFFQQAGPISYKLSIQDFSLTQADYHQIRSSNVKIQVMCMQLDDPVQFRFHWPVNCKLSINQKDFRVYPRHADNKVTEGQRDEPADISKLILVGKNRIELSCQDANQFIFCIQIVTPIPKERVLDMIHPPENLEASIMRMRRIVRSQLASDYDDEVQTTTSMMSLRCPFSTSRIRNPARLLNIDSLQCVFDLDAFISMVERTRKWACPHSVKQSSVHHLVKDVWLEAVLKSLQKLPAVMEVEVSKEGTWRLRGEKNKWRSVYNTTVIEEPPEGFVAEQTRAAGKTDLDEESETEEEELRKAAQDAKQAFKQHCQEKAQVQNLEVVDLVSSDEELEIQVHPVAHSAPYPVEHQVIPIMGPEAMRSLKGFAAPLSEFMPYRPTQLPTPMSLGRQIGSYRRTDVPVNFQMPSRLGTPYGNVRPAHAATYQPPIYNGTYAVAPVQMHHKDGTIVVKNTSISIPSDGIPKPAKRSGAPLEPQKTYRKTERKRQDKRTLTARQMILPMECIEIDQDSE